MANLNSNSNLINQYLNKDTLLKNIPEIDVKPTDLGTTDTYHEEKILMKYLSHTLEAQNLIYKAAIQLAIVGYGKKNYGFIRLNDKDILTLTSLFDKYKIKYNEKINVKYLEDELSARRLIRLFRFQIQKFIIQNKRPSYLWSKYANKIKIEYMSICFPGGEHLVETKDQALFLLDTYGQLDIAQQTKFRDRLKRVFIARNIIGPEYFMNINY